MRVIQPHREKGFTLIELMVALVLLSIGLFSVIQLQVVTVRGGAFARERTEAQELANAVAEEMRTRALQWVDNQVLADPDLVADVFNNEIEITATPATGADLAVADMRSVVMFRGVPIANTTAFGDAKLVNGRGVPQDAASALDAAGCIYRIHYVAHEMRLNPADALTLPDLVRFTILVSWDNKDHAQSNYDPFNWSDPVNYWRRHMVVVTFFLNRHRLW